MPRDLLPWWDQLDWTADPVLAFARGLAIGIEIGAETYGRAAAAAAGSALRLIDTADARRAADTAGPRAGDYPGMEAAA